ncbi:hypothetical protein LCM18_02110 [Qipengyuania flava]|nr:hypothetical protein LCM18_02110 [Qipengyuania flava]
MAGVAMGFELTGLEDRELLALTGAYLLVSFVLAALLVRLAAQAWPARVARHNPWLFPLIPPLATLALARIVLLGCATVSDRVLRTAFRVISGKHSYRRVPIDRYGRYRERRHFRR